MAQTLDAIVVGARCTGSPAAMLLSRLRYRVLVAQAVRPEQYNDKPPILAAYYTGQMNAGAISPAESGGVVARTHGA